MVHRHVQAERETLEEASRPSFVAQSQQRAASITAVWGGLVQTSSKNPNSPIAFAAAIRYSISAGWSSLVARWAHNPKVAGSNPAPATNAIIELRAISKNL